MIFNNLSSKPTRSHVTSCTKLQASHASTRHIVVWLQQLRIELVNLLGLTIWLAQIVRFAQFAEFAQIGQIDLGEPVGLG